MSSSIEKGLTQCFLWLSPKPSYSKYSSLDMIDEDFTSYIGKFVS
jgi:hypothetical protein